MFQATRLIVLIFPVLMAAQFNQKKLTTEELLNTNKVFITKVVSVPQGDLVSINFENELIGVRLVGIDSPEPRQPFFRQSREFTEEITLGQTVKVTTHYVDRFQRIIGELRLLDGKVINHELVRWGFAWYYRVSPKSNPILEQLEFEAWKKKLGLWTLDEPIPPWKFRAGSQPLDPPLLPKKVDYDRIFEYGLFGDQKTKLYSWPHCSKYRVPPREQRLIFSNKLEAENFGYRISPNCSN